MAARKTQLIAFIALLGTASMLIVMIYAHKYYQKDNKVEFCNSEIEEGESGVVKETYRLDPLINNNTFLSEFISQDIDIESWIDYFNEGWFGWSIQMKFPKDWYLTENTSGNVITLSPRPYNENSYGFVDTPTITIRFASNILEVQRPIHLITGRAINKALFLPDQCRWKSRYMELGDSVNEGQTTNYNYLYIPNRPFDYHGYIMVEAAYRQSQVADISKEDFEIIMKHILSTIKIPCTRY